MENQAALNPINEDLRIFNTFISNDSQCLNSLRNMNQNTNENGIVLSSQESPPFGFDQRAGVSQMNLEMSKEKILKTPLQNFLQNSNEISTDTEMLNDDSPVAKLNSPVDKKILSFSWQELTSIWNESQSSFIKREYWCDYCPMTFDKKTALGGHTSKHHPNKSTDYQYRQKSLKNWQIERERQKFYKNLKTSDFL